MCCWQDGLQIIIWQINVLITYLKEELGPGTSTRCNVNNLVSLLQLITEFDPRRVLHNFGLVTHQSCTYKNHNLSLRILWIYIFNFVPEITSVIFERIFLIFRWVYGICFFRKYICKKCKILLMHLIKYRFLFVRLKWIYRVNFQLLLFTQIEEDANDVICCAEIYKICISRFNILYYDP